ncbi:hypothetical protein [Terriglobus sp. RCC_193]|uniref:hypothetical protein n=1 Tax=Terriglobus sp. RCC_193 TaxID=3239218 RepID=UPI003524B3F7
MSLRDQLHQRSVLVLKMAQAEVAVAMQAVTDGQQRISAYRTDQMTAMVDGDHEQWLMARSGTTLSSIASVQMLQHQRTREQAVAVVAQNEVQLRRELRQVEQVMARAVREERVFTSRKEQQQLEEVARLVGNSRGKISLPLEPT